MSDLLGASKEDWKHRLIRLIFSVPFPSIYHTHNYSLQRLWFARLGVIWNYIFSKLIVEKSCTSALSGTKSKRGYYQGRTALVVGNGPSANDMNWEVVESLRVKGELLLFLVNYSLNDKTLGKIGCDYLVLSDPQSHPREQIDRTVELWKNISQIPGIKLITPIAWHLSSELLKCRHGECLHFSDLSLESFSSSVSPLRARGYPSMTAYKALAFADFLGFDLIYVVGVDNSMFRSIKVDSQNRIQQLPHYFSDNYGPTVDVSNRYPSGISDYFYELSVLFSSLHRCFGAKNIVNLGLESEVDAFPKIAFDAPGFNLLKSK